MRGRARKSQEMKPKKLAKSPRAKKEKTAPLAGPNVERESLNKLEDLLVQSKLQEAQLKRELNEQILKTKDAEEQLQAVTERNTRLREGLAEDEANDDNMYLVLEDEVFFLREKMARMKMLMNKLVVVVECCRSDTPLPEDIGSVYEIINN